jgi:ankyrin repeat protein
MSAAAGGDVDCVDALLPHSSIDAKDENGRTALILAALFGYTQPAEKLLDAGANIQSEDHNGYTALHWAAAMGQANAVRTLMSRGANTEAKGHEGATPLICAAAFDHSEEKDNQYVRTVEALLAGGSYAGARDGDGRTAFDWAKRKGYRDEWHYRLRRKDLGKTASWRAWCQVRTPSSATRFVRVSRCRIAAPRRARAPLSTRFRS